MHGENLKFPHTTLNIQFRVVLLIPISWKKMVQRVCFWWSCELQHNSKRGGSSTILGVSQTVSWAQVAPYLAPKGDSTADFTPPLTLDLGQILIFPVSLQYYIFNCSEM